MDTLSQLLSYSNVHAGAKLLVVDDTQGMIVSALAERMGGKDHKMEITNIVNMRFYLASFFFGTTNNDHLTSLGKGTILGLYDGDSPHYDIVKYMNFDKEHLNSIKTLSWGRIHRPAGESKWREVSCVCPNTTQDGPNRDKKPKP